MSEKIHKSSIRVKISVQNVIILHGCMAKSRDFFCMYKNVYLNKKFHIKPKIFRHFVP